MPPFATATAAVEGVGGGKGGGGGGGGGGRGPPPPLPQLRKQIGFPRSIGTWWGWVGRGDGASEGGVWGVIRGWDRRRSRTEKHEEEEKQRRTSCTPPAPRRSLVPPPPNLYCTPQPLNPSTPSSPAPHRELCPNFCKQLKSTSHAWYCPRSRFRWARRDVTPFDYIEQGVTQCKANRARSRHVRGKER